MSRSSNKEIWKEVTFDFEYTNQCKIEVSNFGRVRNTTEQYGVTILKGANVNGYRVVRLRFTKKRPAKDQKRIDFFREQIAKLVRQSGKMRTRNKMKRIKDESYYAYEAKIKELEGLLAGLKKKYYEEFRLMELKRTINHGGLIHRLVAEYFLKKPSPAHNFVAHLDFNKSNNQASNLRWMTQKELGQHHNSNPNVIKQRADRKARGRIPSKLCKLTPTKVMLIKKKLNEGVTLRKLAKSFKVSDMQISRIKRGENWADIEAAK